MQSHLGYIYRDLSDFDNALTAFNAAIDLDADHPDNYYNIATIYQHQGKLDEAEKIFRKNISLHPNHSRSYTALAYLTKIKVDDPLVERMENQLGLSSVSQTIRSELHFALFKIFDDGKLPDLAFHHLDLANQLSDKHFDWQANRQWVNTIINNYPLNQSPVKGENSSNQLVFIVGLPRSGTSLTEQILASHPEVFGVRETSYLLDLDIEAASYYRTDGRYPAYCNQLDSPKLKHFADDLQSRLNADNVDNLPAKRIVEKYPINFVYVGLILQLFPNAKIIHTFRHPLDTCLSCHSKNFRNKALSFTASLTSLGEIYKDYQRLMTHWHQLFPGKILDLNYTELVTSQEQQSRRLIEFVGLDWHEECLNFHQNSRTVQSASFTQIRRPMYQSSIGRWKPYARQLQPLADILDLDISKEIEALSRPSPQAGQ